MNHPVLACPLQGDKAAHNFLSEAIVRSLPKALSTAERERVLASTPLSPTLNLLSSMPLVRGRPAAQAVCKVLAWCCCRYCCSCCCCGWRNLSCLCCPNPTVLKTPATRIQDRVNSRTSEGARLRRHVLRGAVVVFITAGGCNVCCRCCYPSAPSK